MATIEELESLKRDWLNDPCWDIEDTEGFEDHREELLMFSDQEHQKWADFEKVRIANVAETMGIPGNTAVAYLVESLQRRVTELEGKVGLIKSNSFFPE
jgi:hypothetical protein